MKKAIINTKAFIENSFIDKNIIIENNKIIDIIDSGNIPKDIEIFDAQGAFLIPGLIDMHVHLREPGFTYKEDIKTGSEAAAAGGFTQIYAMPNTKPVMDNVETINEFYKQVKQKAIIKVFTYAAITDSLVSNQLTDFKNLVDAGAFAFTNDGVGVQSSSVMYEAMIQAATINKAIVAHCEDNDLIYGGCIHKGKTSEKLNLLGIPSICESVQIARDVLLAEASNCHYHVCHISTKESVRIVREAKKAGIKVTAEVTPHHLILNEEDIKEKDPNYKMNPPLRSKEDQQALIEGLLDGTIDIIATDHAPHSEEEKSNSIEKAPFGIIGLEHAFSLMYTYFVKKNICTPEQLINWMSRRPAEIFNREGGKIEIGSSADLALLDLDYSYIIDKPFVSKSANTPFLGKEVFGKVKTTFVDGKIVYQMREKD